MVSSVEIGIMTKFNQLNERYGLRITDSETSLNYVHSDDTPERCGYYFLENFSVSAYADVSEKVEKVQAAIGMKEGYLKIDDMSDFEDRLDQALSLAPRPRIR